MAPSPKNPTSGNKNTTTPSLPQDATACRGQETNYAPPMLVWLRQSEKDEPWRGFTVAAAGQQNGQTRDYPAGTDSRNWSTEAKAGSEGGR
ncbi:hypothetical protein F53441_5995 [Fusarium austroafricanum]|uniref:Uncharacterized protein n=1 Tax=Fusarium austroafricanum TaxID=2364996 RepID=A0A8H4KJQ8_9HYPO|nr:hypothetical protein F53441_5995 [Fusarium austroafricanum]